MSDLSSKFADLLAKERLRLDRTLGNDIRELRANYGSGSYTVLLMQQRYQADIEERVSTLLGALKRLLASSPEREIRDNKSELDRLAQAWLQAHIEDCQSNVNRQAAKIGEEDPGKYDLGGAHLLKGLAVELDLLSAVPELKLPVGYEENKESFEEARRRGKQLWSQTSIRSAPAPSAGEKEPQQIPEEKHYKWDLFISHASEDKEFVRPLALTLQRLGLKVWYDEFTLSLGDSLRESIDHGLANSRFGVVVVSRSFLAKGWPQRELDGLMALEIHGRKVILPVWHQIGAEGIGTHSPILADRFAAISETGVEAVARRIAERVRLAPNPGHQADG